MVSNLVSKVSGTIMQLVQVPVFLHFWAVPLFGEWMILSSIPTYLSFSNIGFGSVAYNEMTMSIGSGDRDRALRVFQSCWWLIIVLCLATGIVLGLVLYFLPLTEYLALHQIKERDAKLVLLLLGGSVLFGQLEQLLGSAYTCVGLYSFGNFLKSCLTLSAFAATMLSVTLHCGVLGAALVTALANVFGTVYLCISVRRKVPWIAYGWKHAHLSEIRRLTTPAIAFMAFPLGNALNLQGSVLAVGYALGPTSVVVFGTARTVSRVALQVIQMVNATIWPELSSAYGSENWPLIRTLHRRSCQIALILALFILPAMATLGPWFLNHWTNGVVAPNRVLLTILLLVVVVNTLWSSSSTLPVAINKHQFLASYYVLATGVTVIFTYLGAKYFGIYGASTSLLVCEIVMSVIVLPNSLKLSHDRFGDFVRGILSPPASVNFRDIWKRLSAFMRLRHT